MTLIDRVVPEAAGPHPGRRRRSAVLIGAAVGVAVAVTVGVLVAVRGGQHAKSGSGVPATDVRALPAFTAVDLAGTNRVTVRVGAPQRVVVHADRNLLDRVVTRVRSGVLIVDDRGSFTTHSAMSVVVSAPSLRAVTLSGTGEVAVTGAAASTFAARLSGSGTLLASGRADTVSASLSGDGTLRLSSLRARSVTVVMSGTGTATVQATESLDATLAGTGTIVFSGRPSHVGKKVTGTGTITAAP